MDVLTVIAIGCAILSVVMVTAAYLFVPADEDPGYPEDGADLDNWTDEAKKNNNWGLGEVPYRGGTIGVREQVPPHFWLEDVGEANIASAQRTKKVPPLLWLWLEDLTDWLDDKTGYRNKNVGRDHRRKKW